jgi:hypothetical protein
MYLGRDWPPFTGIRRCLFSEIIRLEFKIRRTMARARTDKEWEKMWRIVRQPRRGLHFQTSILGRGTSARRRNSATRWLLLLYTETRLRRVGSVYASCVRYTTEWQILLRKFNHKYDRFAALSRDFMAVIDGAVGASISHPTASSTGPKRQNRTRSQFSPNHAARAWSSRR